MRARMVVPHKRYVQGEEVFGCTADKMLAAGLAVEVPAAVPEEENEAPAPKKKAPAKKALNAAPENK